VAVFVSPDHPDQDYVKRVIGLPGDTVLVKQGHPWLNGREVPHCKVAAAQPPGAEGPGELELEFLDGRAYLIYFELERGAEAQEGPWRIPPSEAFVLGDNRNNSLDSRRFFEGRGGGVPFANLKGPPLFIWLAFGDAGEVTWDRMGVAVDEIHLPPSMGPLDVAVRACLSAHTKDLSPAR
jgi:signal peptidase I